MSSSEPLVVVPGRLYTTQETADYLRVLVKTLEVWRATGRYPALESKKSGGKVVKGPGRKRKLSKTALCEAEQMLRRGDKWHEVAAALRVSPTTLVNRLRYRKRNAPRNKR